MDETDNHKLRLAPPGWHSRLKLGRETNRNFEKLDTVTKGLSDDGESLNIDRASINSLPVAYEVHTDGSTIYGEPQFAEGSRVTDTDIGSFLESIVVDQMIPQGNAAEAFGEIRFKSHSDFYPGTLSSVPVLNVSGLRLRGETFTHALDEASGGPNRPSQPGVGFKTDGVAFVPPADADIDSGDEPVNFTRISTFSIVGAGNSTGAAFDFEANTDLYGWHWFDNISIQKVGDPFRFVSNIKDTPLFARGLNIAGFKGEMDVPRTMRLRDSYMGLSDGGRVLVDGKLTDSQIHGVGETTELVRVQDVGVLKDTTVAKVGGTDGTGTAIAATDHARVIRPNQSNEWSSSQAFGTFVRIDGISPTVADIQDAPEANTSIDIDSSANYPHIRGEVPRGSVVDNGASGPRWEGVMGGGPLGGVDTDSLNGQYLGDLAVSNTTSDEIAVRWDGTYWHAMTPVRDTYTGDGTTGRLIRIGFTPKQVILRANSQDVEMHHNGFYRITLEGTEMAGGFSLKAAGFEVGDNGGNQDPNTDGEQYDYYAQ